MNLRAAVAYYQRLGIPIRRILTDNGACYHSREFAEARRRLGIRHRFTRPYTPRTKRRARAGLRRRRFLGGVARRTLRTRRERSPNP